MAHECLMCGKFFHETNAALATEYCCEEHQKDDQDFLVAAAVSMEDYKTEQEIEQEKALKTVQSAGGFNLRLNVKPISETSEE